jgi:hypothetical protein
MVCEIVDKHGRYFYTQPQLLPVKTPEHIQTNGLRASLPSIVA